MSENILEHVKIQCGIEPESTLFDDELIQDINLALSLAYQLGGISESTSITGTETWDELSWPEYMDKELVKSYISLKVRHNLFDASTSGTLSSTADKVLTDLEYRISLLTVLNE
jgi:hypothetical protein